MASTFTCPYCNQPTTLTEPNEYTDWEKIIIEESKKGPVALIKHAVTCPNPDCKHLFLEVKLTNVQRDETTGWNYKPTKILKQWQLLPESSAKVLPEYVPQAVKNDYYEACRIKDLSPKASATLSRRCLQGMIRNFWEISKPTLKEELEELKNKVEPDIWESIDAVRNVGNIGAHMEKDINLIINVEPEEAQLLIGLIEQLIDDWYVARDNRRKRTEQLKILVASKQKEKTDIKK